MKDKIKALLAQKMEEDEQLEKEFEGEGLRFTVSDYTERKDKLEIEIDLLNSIIAWT